VYSRETWKSKELSSALWCQTKERGPSSSRTGSRGIAETRQANPSKLILGSCRSQESAGRKNKLRLVIKSIKATGKRHQAKGDQSARQKPCLAKERTGSPLKKRKRLGEKAVGKKKRREGGVKGRETDRCRRKPTSPDSGHTSRIRRRPPGGGELPAAEERKGGTTQTTPRRDAVRVALAYDICGPLQRGHHGPLMPNLGSQRKQRVN